MMLQDKFFTMVSRSAVPGQVEARISFNADHPIFKGHFPGLPVVPGVCMMQIAREIMEVSLGKPLAIVSADNMKFMSVIDPNKNTEVDVKVAYSDDGDSYSVNASIFTDNATFFKMKATLSGSPWK